MAKTISTCPSRISGELTGEHCPEPRGGGAHECVRARAHVVDEGVAPHRCACGWNWNVRDGERAEYLRDAAPWPGRSGPEPVTPDATGSAVQVVHLEAGDLVVFEVDGVLSEGEYRHIRDRILSQFGGTDVNVNAVVLERAHLAAILRAPTRPDVRDAAEAPRTGAPGGIAGLELAGLDRHGAEWWAGPCPEPGRGGKHRCHLARLHRAMGVYSCACACGSFGIHALTDDIADGYNAPTEAEEVVEGGWNEE